MAFKKGEPRAANAGRKKGSLNKKTVARVSDYLAEKEINPTERILNLINSGLEPRDELKAWLELLSYTQAKPKPAEEILEDEQDDEEYVEQLRDVTDEKLIEYLKSKEKQKA